MNEDETRALAASAFNSLHFRQLLNSYFGSS